MKAVELQSKIAKLESKTTKLQSGVRAMESELTDLHERIERLEIEMAVRRSEAQFERGEGIPMRQAIQSLRQKHHIPTKNMER